MARGERDAPTSELTDRFSSLFCLVTNVGKCGQGSGPSLPSEAQNPTCPSSRFSVAATLREHKAFYGTGHLTSRCGCSHGRLTDGMDRQPFGSIKKTDQKEAVLHGPFLWHAKI